MKYQAINDALKTDEELYDEAVQANEESFPMALLDRMLDGEHPIKAFRKYRGLKQKDLAKKVGLSTLYISQLETGRRNGTTQTLRKIADALNVEIDDLV